MKKIISSALITVTLLHANPISAQTITPPRNVATVDTEAPTTPIGLAGVPRFTSVTISWQAATDNVGVTGYRIYRDNQLIAITNDLIFVNRQLTEGTTYTYQVAAIDGAGNVSARSEVLTMTTLTTEGVDTQSPSVPSQLHGTTTSDSATIHWTAATDNVGIASYRVYRNHVLVGTTTSEVTSFTDTNLEANTSYVYTVRAIDVTGNFGGRSSGLTLTTSEVTPEITEPEIITPEPITPEVTLPEITTPEPIIPEVTVPETNYAEWCSETVYDFGDRVRFEGKIYSARWWVLGEAPSAAEGWKLVDRTNPIKWRPSTIFDFNDVVTYNGRLFRAKWWTQGDSPANSSVWEEIIQ